MATPQLDLIDGVYVVREDLYPPGTKGRYLPRLIAPHDEVVYASPGEGFAQVSIARVARALGKRATIFVARRGQPHERTLEAHALGARIVQVAPGYMTVCQARARAYCAASGAHRLPFGLANVGGEEEIAALARTLPIVPGEVWCAAGSGTLARGLALAWPNAARFAVQVGRDLSLADVGFATLTPWHQPFGARGPAAPFPADPHYEAKAWALCSLRKRADRTVLFWNASPPASLGTALPFEATEIADVRADA